MPFIESGEPAGEGFGHGLRSRGPAPENESAAPGTLHYVMV
jgi:hypothetical protein